MQFRKIYTKAIDLLAIREYGDRELEQKLLYKFSKELDELELQDTILKVIVKLKSMGYLNNKRFVEAQVRLMLQKFCGPLKINYVLQDKVSDIELIKEYINIEEQDWLNLGTQALFKKFGEYNLSRQNLSYKYYGDNNILYEKDKQKKIAEKLFAKHVRFLQARGFKDEQVIEAISQYEQKNF